MSNLERIKLTAQRILERVPSARGKGEEATKQALVLPMLDALGYDIWNPAEVCPEYEADFALKKAGQKEKVDFAIAVDGTPQIYLEVKVVETPLDGHEGQLARYFNSTPSVALAVLTNGVEYRFFTDTGDENIMDAVPFHSLKLDHSHDGIDVMARFAKPVFAAEAIRDYARDLIYTDKIAAFLRNELDVRERDPSETIIRWVLSEGRMYEGKITGHVVERFKSITKNGLQRVLREIVRRSVAAMEKEVSKPDARATTVEGRVNPGEPPAVGATSPLDAGKPVTPTSEAELDCFAVIKGIFLSSAYARASIYDSAARKEHAVELAYKSTTGYFAIYLNKPSNWLMRIVVDVKNPWVGFNLPPEVAAPLVPAGFPKLDPSAFADFRLPFKQPSDLAALRELIIASFEQTISARKPQKEPVLQVVSVASS